MASAAFVPSKAKESPSNYKSKTLPDMQKFLTNKMSQLESGQHLEPAS